MALNSKVHVRELKTPKRNYKWLATFKEADQIRKRYFVLKQDADNFKKKQEKDAKEHGTNVYISSTERAVIADTREALAEAGLSLREAVGLALERSAKLKKSCTIAELYASLTKEKEAEGASPAYLADIKSRLGRFSKEFGKRNAGGIEPQEISDWLAGLGVSPTTQANYRRLLVILFNHGRRLKFCPDNPAEDAMKPKIKESAIGIVTPAEAERVLNACDPKILPAAAIGLFAGVRDAELKRLDWAGVDLEGGFITVAADDAKSARRRLIPIRSVLAEWLKPYSLKKRGKVWPKNGRRLVDAARLEAGFGTEALAKAHNDRIAAARKAKQQGKPGNDKAAKLVKVDPAKLKEWPSNAARHSFASYALASEQDAAKVALELGHTDTGIIFQHYRELVRPAEAEKYWAILPGRRQRKDKVISLATG